jgi:hypothetical protein
MLGLKYNGPDRVVIVLHNLAGTEVTAALRQLEKHVFRHEIFSDCPYEAPNDGMWELNIRCIRYRWFNAEAPAGTGSTSAAEAASRALEKKAAWPPNA